SGTRVDIDNGVQLIVFTGQQDLGFHTIDKTFSLIQVRRQIVNNGLTFARELDQGLHVVNLAYYLAIKFKAFFEAGALLENFAGAFLIRPEVWFRYLFL